MKIALFGGSFNPVHEGHLKIATEAFLRYRFDRFFFLPAYCSPFKRNDLPADGPLRAEMLRAAISLYKEYPFEIDDYELTRGSVSYSVDTVLHFKKLFPDADITWIGGDDILPDLPCWKDSERLSREVSFLIFCRGFGTVLPPVPDGFAVDFIPIPPVPYSSSRIRSQIAAGCPVGEIPGLMPAVAEIIEREGLYR